MDRSKVKQSKFKERPALTQGALLHRMTSRIRRSLELQEILTATVAELRSLLETDRTEIYRFLADGSGEVIAESVDLEQLPSLLGLTFPARDIPENVRQLFVKARQRVIVDVAAQLSIVTQLDCLETGELLPVEDIRYYPADPCHLEYLTAMGVQSCLVVPILHHNQLWGLLISHHSQSRNFDEQELQSIQTLADQVSIAIAQSSLLSQAREQAQREATINRIATLLHTVSDLTEVLPAVLREITNALQCASGRLYIGTDGLQPAQLYSYGEQPILANAEAGRWLEESIHWQQFVQSDTGSGSQPPWAQLADDRNVLRLQAVTDLYREPGFQVLAPAFQRTQLRGLLVLPLQYQQKLLGYLSIFRNEIETETLWAGRNDSDARQLRPRKSFEAWRELKSGQSQEWTSSEIELAQALVSHLAIAWTQKRSELERQRMEEELIKARKLESVGILAGGIAHDFNNILTIILGNVSLAQMDVPVGSQSAQRLSEAKKASQRAKDLTQQLLTFSKGGAPIRKTVSIVGLIKDSVSFASRGSNVKCEISIAEDLWPVDVDEGQMSQVINNLMINAEQAMPEGGVVRIKAENIVVEADGFLPLKAGRHVKISIRDEGIGVPHESLSKIFDPYFTTKQKGSGLGLATSYSIIKNHSGLITVESEVCVGTIFYIYLPASQHSIQVKESEKSETIAGKGKILVMDDEAQVREIAGKMLTRFGYEVGFASDGAEAIRLYKRAKKSGRPFDALIMDLTVPGGMGGREAIKKLMAIDPGVKVIVSSGYSNDPVIAQFQKYGFQGLLAKPYEFEELSRTLNEVLVEEGEDSPTASPSKAHP